jgi:hypothetical protein
MLLEHMWWNREHVTPFVAQEAAEEVVKQPANGPQKAYEEVINVGTARCGTVPGQI